MYMASITYCMQKYIFWLIHYLSCQFLSKHKLHILVIDPTLIDDFFNISITTLELKDDRAYMAWSISGEQTPIDIFVNISQLDSESHTLLSTGDFPVDQDSVETCFDNLNNTDIYRYQFCVTASLPDGTMPHTCAFPTTVDDLPSSEIDCINVTDGGNSLGKFSLKCTFRGHNLLAVFVCSNLTKHGFYL